MDKFYHIIHTAIPTHSLITGFLYIARTTPAVSTAAAAVPFANPLFRQHYIILLGRGGVVLSNDYYILPCGPVRYGPRQEFLVMRE